MLVFKPGDRIRCIFMPLDYYDRLQVGSIYTVMGYEDDSKWLMVKENDGINAYQESCFEKVVQLNYREVL